MKTAKLILIILLFCFSINIAQETNLSNMFRLAQTFERSGEFEEAKRIYENIYEAQPWNIKFIEALNNIYIVLKEYDKSVELLNRKINSEPGNTHFYGLLGETYYAQGDTAKAFETWDNGLAVSSQSVVAYRVITNHALQNRAFNKVIEYLQRGKKLDNGFTVFAVDLARVYSMTMNFKKAAREYCNLIQTDPKMTQLALNNMTQYLNRPQAINETIEAVEEFAEDEEEPEIFRVLIHLYQLNDDYDNALANVKKLESEISNDGKEYFRFAQQTLLGNQFEIASKAFQSLIDEYPNSPLVPPARIGFAKSYEESLNGKRDSLVPKWKPLVKAQVVLEEEYLKAIQSYKKIYELYPNSDVKNEAVFRIAEIYFIKLNRPETAIEYYTEVLNSNSVSQFAFESKLRLAEINIKKNNIGEAENEIFETINNFNLPGNFKSKADLLLGRVYFWSGKFKAASEKLSDVTKNLFDDNANDALQLMTLVNTLKNDSTTLANYAAADLLAHQQNYSNAADKFNELKESQNPIISELAGLKYAQVLVAQDNYSDALSVLAKTTEESSLKMFDAEIQYLIGEIKYYALKDYEGALQAYRNILESYGNSLYFDKSREKIEYINELKKKLI